MGKPILALALSGLAIMQVGVLHHGVEPEQIGIDRGEAFPVPIMALDSQRSVLSDRGCVVVFICTSSCPHCAARAAARAELEPDGSIDILWAILGSREAAAEFASRYTFGPDELGVLGQPEDGFFRGRHLVVPATPLRVILDYEHVVAAVDLAHEVPHTSQLSGLCK